jgi:3-oxoadipate CoA-transferase beta subunit
LRSGLPSLAADYLPADREIVLLKDNGLLGIRPKPRPDDGDRDLINAGKEPVTAISGAGDLANWQTGSSDAIPAVRGAMDLAIGAKRVFVMMEHLTRSGEPKIAEAYSNLLTGLNCVSRICTYFEVIDVTPSGLALVETLGQCSFEELARATAAPILPKWRRRA